MNLQPKPLSKLLTAVPHIITHSDINSTIAGIVEDSRQIQPGFAFVARSGEYFDGYRFIPAAIAAGAVAIMGEKPRADVSVPPDVAYIQVRNAAEAFGWLLAGLYNFPSRKLVLIGVTGTDGKTTTVNLLHAMLQANGYAAGMVSTLNARIGNTSYATGLHVTTPTADAVQRYLADMVAVGMTHAVLETTSHGLAQQRLAGCDFDVAVVTNITHEHLDHHGSWAAYRDAKALLFRGLTAAARKPDQAKVAVINRDDGGSYDFLHAIPVEQSLVYATHPQRVDASTQPVWAEDVHFTPQGLGFTLHSPWGRVNITASLVGMYNVSNILAAASAALALGVSLDAVAEGVHAIKGVPGRMERIDEGQAFSAIVDFAHTPNALRVTLETAKQRVSDGGRVIVAFGSAGLRDREKRRMMGEVAGELADLIVLTAEDPRTEPLNGILDEMARGVLKFARQEGVDFWRVPDRGAALLFAVQLARPGDIVLACGKGHEQSMCFGDVEYAWDDRDALRSALRGVALATLPTADKK